jgi:hypothetical protein
MDKNAFDLYKNNARTNVNSRLHETPIINYGYVIEVIDRQTVVVVAAVQSSLTVDVFTVSLLSTSSDELEVNVYPKLGDPVLLLFLQRHNPAMFSGETINDPDAVGYNKFSGVGMLKSTLKNAAKTIMNLYEDNGTSVAEVNSKAEIKGTFHNLMAILFCRAIEDSDDEQLISMCFGQGRPFFQRFLSKVEREHGFWTDSEKELMELDASVTERYSIYSPITKDIQGAQALNVGLGKDKNGNPIETDAPITETIHGKAPVERVIRSPQSIIIGTGNDETGDAEEQRDASVNIEIGEKADITLTSKSGATAQFKKMLDLLFEDAMKLVSKKAVTLKSDSSELLEIGNQIATLGALVSEFLGIVINLDTVGSPANHTTGPMAKPKLIALKAKWEQVFK